MVLSRLGVLRARARQRVGPPLGGCAAEIKWPLASTFKYFGCFGGTDVGNTVTITLRVNGADSPLVLTFTNAVSGSRTRVRRRLRAPASGAVREAIAPGKAVAAHRFGVI